MSDTLLAEGTLLKPSQSGTYVARSGTVDGQMARGSGFTMTSFVKGYSFLFFGASGELVAGSNRSNGGRTIAVSTDDGVTWTERGTPDATYGPNLGWMSSADTWFVLCGLTLYRSTDQGNTWTPVLTIGTGSGLLDQGFTEGPAGTLYAAEYQGTGKIWQSTDDGVTWAQHSQFLTTDHGDAPGANTVRHIHGINYLPSGLWAYTGDNNTEAGLWKWSGSAWVRQTPSSTDPVAQQWRAVGLTERSGNLYWMQDGAGGTLKPVVGYAPASNPGNWTKIADVPTGGWYIRSLSDGTLIVGGVVEADGQEEDSLIRLWAIDSANNLKELWGARRNRSANSSQFGRMTALRVRASDDLVAIRLANSELSDLANDPNVLILGRVTKGARPSTAVVPPTMPIGSGRTWVATPTTSAPTTTASSSGTPDTLPEMTLTVQASGAPILLMFESGFANNTAAGLTNFAWTFDGATGAATSNTRTKQCGNANYVDRISMQTVWTPTPGKHTVTIKWWVASGNTATARNLERSLVAVELGR